MKWDGICVLPPLPSRLLPRSLATDATWPFFPSSSMPSSFLSQGLCTRGFLLLEPPDLPVVGSFPSLGPQLRCHLLGGGGPSVITPSKRALHPPSLCTVSIPLGFCHSRFLVSVLIVKHQERRSLFGSFMAVEQGLVHSRGSVGNLCLSLLMGHLRPLVLPLFRSIFHTTVGLSF